MAFQLTNPAASASTSAARADNYEKAVGFINISLPSTNGGVKKLGAIALRASVPAEKALFDYLQGGEANVQAFVNALAIDFRAVQESSFALPTIAVPAAV